MSRGRMSGTTGAPKPREWFGVYLGRIAQVRLRDVCVKVQVPQLFGQQHSNWARPMGFNVVGQLGGSNTYSSDVNSVVNSGTDIDVIPASHFGPFVDVPSGPAGRSLGFSAGDSGGPGPPVGTIVLVMFVGGDINMPVYFLTTQKVSPSQ